MFCNKTNENVTKQAIKWLVELAQEEILCCNQNEIKTCGRKVKSLELLENKFLVEI